MAFEEDPPASAPEWIVTFSDMVSLLVTFFVLLLTFTSSGAMQTVKTKLRLSGSSGIFPRDAGSDAMEDPRAMELIESTSALDASTEQHSRPDIQLPEDLAHMGQKLDALHIPADLNEIFDGIALRFGPECSFAPGTATPTPELAKSLKEMARVLPHYPLLITVEGHADGHFQPTEAFPDADSIGLARAHAAARILTESGLVAAKDVMLCTHGARIPREGNDSPMGRMLNRRVEIRLLKAPAVLQGKR
ncbi:MAG: type secretion system protein TssL [Planctomycetota bacterium]|jgi:chemotaxis protein MotB